MGKWWTHDLHARPSARAVKVATYIAENRLQVILTPDNEYEAKMLRMIEKKDIISMYRGSFYGCQGGWHRWSSYGYNQQDDDSLILVLDEPKDAASP